MRLLDDLPGDPFRFGMNEAVHVLDRFRASGPDRA